MSTRHELEDEWFKRIKDVIQAARDAGVDLGGYSDCCGCSRDIHLVIGKDKEIKIN